MYYTTQMQNSGLESMLSSDKYGGEWLTEFLAKMKEKD